MTWDVEGTDEFDAWFVSLNEAEQEDVIAVVDLLEQHGPHLGFPHSSAVSGSRHSHMRELRIQHLDVHIVFSTPSIPAERRSCCSAATKQETTVGTISTCRLPTVCMNNIWSRSRGRV